jgi:putative ABC transport system substrate-binding protein
VFLGVGAPVEIGLIQSLSHPGGNMTGVTFEAASETYARRLQILQEIVPDLRRVAVQARIRVD